MLIWHDFSDEKLSPYTAVNHYKQLAKRRGGYAKLQQNVRMFMLPGTSHCGGGAEPVGPNNFDALGAMENWVEKGIAPDALPAKLYVPALTGGVQYDKPLNRTMPLCKFPEMAHYSGEGDVNDGANWSCPANDSSLLRIGESGRQAGVIE
jgi:feruloyl esterase